MSGGYIGRRGINVSVYLQDLNTLPSADEQVDAFNPDDLDIWTNTQFFDFDMGVAAHDPAEATREQKPPAVEPAPAAPIDPTLKDGGEFDNFLNEFKEFENFDYSQAYVTGFSDAGAQPSLTTAPVLPGTTAAAPGTERTLSQPIASASIGGCAASNTAASPAAPAIPAPSSASPTAPRGAKRKASVSVSAASPDVYEGMEDASRLAADEDKRRRNTAASARFRVKKKQKEQQLEKTAKDMTERVHALEQRVQQLELENKWLKGLIVEKNGGKSGEEMMMPPSILAGSKDGVGTV